MVKKKIVMALVALILFTGLGGKVENFDWLAGDSAPEDYPMQIVSGDFIYPDGDSLYIPNGRTLHYGWGIPESRHIVGPELKPLPSQLEITFFSYTENEFYQGSFDLPYKKILNLFDTGYYSPKKREQTTYSRIFAGVAPGGVVSVWVNGLNRRTEVFYGHAEKADIPWDRINNNPDYPRPEYVRLNLQESISPEALESLEQNGVPFGQWDRYHVRYHWHLDVVSPGKPILVEKMDFYNGEMDYRVFPIEDSIKAQPKGIPKHMSFIWKSPEDQAYTIRYTFNEKEILEAFSELAPGNGEVIESPLRLELRIEDRDDGNRYANTWLHGQQKTIQLNLTEIEIKKTSRWSDFY